jgi:hypothetical protein
VRSGDRSAGETVARAVVWATAALAWSTLAGCGGNEGAVVSAPSPLPTLTPTPPPTPVPFSPTDNQTLDIWGWDSWPSAPRPSAILFRWNATIGNYEVLAPGYADWSRLEAVPSQSGGTPYRYDVFGTGGTRLPFFMFVSPPQPDRYVGNARIFEGLSARAYFAFGIATQPGGVPLSGTMTCTFGEDEIGTGTLTVDLAAGTVSGWTEPFWVAGQYQLVQTIFAPGATTFATTFGTDGILEGRFFGPRAENVGVRAKGAVTGIMTGRCGG